MKFLRPMVSARLTCAAIVGAALIGVSGCGASQENYVYTGTAGSGSAVPVMTGRVQFEKLNPTAEIDQDARGGALASLDFSSPVDQPVRFAKLELLDEDDNVLRTGNTDGAGRYRFEVPSGSGPVRVRIYSETIAVTGQSAPISVRDNTQEDAVYAVESDPVERRRLEVDVEIPTGYDSLGNQTGSTRPSAPFACLDGVLTGYRYMLEGGADPSGLPLCKVNWSQQNRPESGELDEGQIETSHFSFSLNELFILGFREADTDEFDWHVMIHEFGHWIQFNRFRFDTVGGEHAGGQLKDPRLAFSEGFGNAFGALALNDPVYKDTSTPTGSGYSLECNGRFGGWFSELSVEAILYDLFDPVRLEGGDSNFDDRIELDRSKFVEALLYQRSSSALTTIFSFLHGLVESGLTPQESQALTALLQRESTSATHGINSLNEFALGETHDGGIYPLPLYTDLASLIGQGPFSVTVGGQEDESALNWLSGVRFYTFVGDGNDITITAENSASTVGGLALVLFEGGTQIAEEGDLDDPFEDTQIAGPTKNGVTYVLVVWNLGTDSSTTNLSLVR